jgi:hypothetical protein
MDPYVGSEILAVPKYRLRASSILPAARPRGRSRDHDARLPASIAGCAYAFLALTHERVVAFVLLA